MVEYRQAQPSDARAIGLLHAQNFRENNQVVFTDTYSAADLSTEFIELWQGRLDQPTEAQFIQVGIGKTHLLGFLCAYGACDFEWGSRIDNLHVDSAARKLGVASSLLAQVGSWLTHRHREQAVYLLVLESNSVARRLYQKFGAVHAETRAMETHGGSMVRNCRYTWPSPRQISLNLDD